MNALKASRSSTSTTTGSPIAAVAGDQVGHVPAAGEGRGALRLPSQPAFDVLDVV
jgi:hypothetical protein